MLDSKRLESAYPQPTASPFEAFGNYLLMERLSTGGMAEIYLARPAVAAANGRILVIKRILPQIAHDPQFVNMFLSEIQVCMGFNHPNIVQLYDFGQVNGQPYIAMEFIGGKSVREITQLFGRRMENMPVAAAVSIAAQVAAGLSYAHTFQNMVTGESMNIIHRDISPQNILISYDGNVKVIDFGIAKAKIDNVEATKTGSIKGKVSYLSPEQSRNAHMDSRSDIFSLAIVLWEMLTGKKLFTLVGRDDLEVIQMIRDSNNHIRPPSAINPDVHPELDAIVLRGLANDPADRYATAADFQKALRDHLLKHFPGFGYRDLAQIVKAVFTHETTAERDRIRDLNASAQQLLMRDGHTASDLTPRPAAASEVTVITPPHGVAVAAVGNDRTMSMALAQKGWLTGNRRLKLLFGLLYVSTIWLLQVDKEYMLFKRFMIPTEVIKMASADLAQDAISGTGLVEGKKRARAKAR